MLVMGFRLTGLVICQNVIAAFGRGTPRICRLAAIHGKTSILRFTLPLVALVFGCGGCGQSLPETIPELSDVAIEAQVEAEAARDVKDPDAAAEAADRADAAVARLIEILEEAANPSDEDDALRQKAVLAAGQARYFAELAEEEQRREDELDRWKATAYRTARNLAWQGTFRGLALAAEQAKGRDLDTLPEPVRESAELAAQLAGDWSGREPTPDGDPDWEGISADMTACADSISARQSQFLALALVLAGQKDLALYEIEMVDQQVPAEQQLEFHLLRGVIYSMHDLQHLAVLEVDKIPEDQRGESEHLLAGVHLFLAYIHLDGKDYEEADREMVKAMQIWPNNPVSVFLTGERLAATGDWEEAANSLEQLSLDSEQAWFAQRIAERARELRDSKGEGQTLLHDKKFMTEVVLRYLWVSAEKSPAAAKLKQKVDDARAFGSRVIEHIPGLGENGEQTE